MNQFYYSVHLLVMMCLGINDWFDDTFHCGGTYFLNSPRFKEEAGWRLYIWKQE